MGNRGSALTVLVALYAGLTGARVAKAEFREQLQQRALQYFIDNSHPDTGLVRDRAPNFGTPDTHSYRMASLAATGFGLAAVANATLRGQIGKADATTMARKACVFAAQKLQHKDGWFYHFVDWETGLRWYKSEVSTIDTTWFLAGAIYAAHVLKDEELGHAVRFIVDRIDFPSMMTHGDNLPKKRTLSMGWTPEFGYLPWQWDSYAEQLLMLIIGLGHPTKPIPIEAWQAFSRPKSTLDNGDTLIGAELPLFAHQYSHLFVDFRGKLDGEIDYFQNSVVATNRDRSQCNKDHSSQTYTEGFWGLSASDSPDGYEAFSPEFHRGTVCLSCAGASAIFTPDLVISELEKWKLGTYSTKLWGKYGFVDGFNLDKNWFGPDVIGITAGALYLALADLDTKTPVWKDFETIPLVKAGLAKAGMIH